MQDFWLTWSLFTHRTVTQDIPLTDQGQSAATTYETVPATYEEIPASGEVKGDYSYTQNNAYLMWVGVRLQLLEEYDKLLIVT